MFGSGTFAWEKVLKQSKTLSHAEIDHACRDAIKEAILEERQVVNEIGLLKTIQERRQTHQR